MDDESQLNWRTSAFPHWVFVVGMILMVYIPPFLHGHINPSYLINNIFVADMSNPEADKSVEVTVKSDDLQPAPVYGLKGERALHPIIERVANSYEVDPALIKAIVMAESSYDSMAISKRGARGLMQLMPSTAEALGVEDSFDPEHNINGGVKYFKRLLNRYDGNIELALAAYNAGSSKVRKYNGIPPYKSTRIYIAKVIEYYQYYKGEKLENVESA